MASQPYLDELKRATPYIVWEWRGVEGHSGGSPLRSYRAVRRGAAKDNFVIESSIDQTAMDEQRWETVTEFEPLLAAFRAFFWHLRERGHEHETRCVKAKKGA